MRAAVVEPLDCMKSLRAGSTRCVALCVPPKLSLGRLQSASFWERQECGHENAKHRKGYR